MFQLVHEAIARRQNVLLHCVAGAHRAGTASCAIAMRFLNMSFDAALAHVNKARSFINIYGELHESMVQLDKELSAARPKAKARLTLTAPAQPDPASGD